MAKSLTLLTLGRSALLFIALLIFPVLLSSPAQAETPTKLYGVITSSEDEPLSDIGISILGPDGFYSQAATNEQGDWEVPILSKGSYSITINVDDLPE